MSQHSADRAADVQAKLSIVENLVSAGDFDGAEAAMWSAQSAASKLPAGPARTTLIGTTLGDLSAAIANGVQNRGAFTKLFRAAKREAGYALTAGGKTAGQLASPFVAAAGGIGGVADFLEKFKKVWPVVGVIVAIGVVSSVGYLVYRKVAA